MAIKKAKKGLNEVLGELRKEGFRVVRLNSYGFSVNGLHIEGREEPVVSIYSDLVGKDLGKFIDRKGRLVLPKVKDVGITVQRSVGRDLTHECDFDIYVDEKRMSWCDNNETGRASYLEASDIFEGLGWKVEELTPTDEASRLFSENPGNS